MQLDTIILDDGIEYANIKNLEIHNTIYVLLANVNNPQDICFRKKIIDNNTEYYIGLDDDNEFKLVSLSFSKDILEKNR